MVGINPCRFRVSTNHRGLPYKSVFCVLTQQTVVVYDTVHSKPLAVANGLHYAGLTDAVWAADGHTLLVSSSDGYVSIVRFGPGELGEVYKEEQDVTAKSADKAKSQETIKTVTTTPPPVETTPNVIDLSTSRKRPVEEEPEQHPQESKANDAKEEMTVHILQPKKKKKKKKKRVTPTLVSA